MTVAAPAARLVDHFEAGLDAPICLTWELTYVCNLACVHCLSSSGRRDPSELTTAECLRAIDELQAMQVFYVNIGGGEPTVRKERCARSRAPGIPSSNSTTLRASGSASSRALDNSDRASAPGCACT